jgi:hypothetical protein
VIAVFAQIYALPGPQVKAAAVDREGQVETGERRLGVGRHVVGPLQGVGPGEVFGDGFVDPGPEIPAHVGRSVLVQGERGRGVPDHEMDQTDREPGDLRDCGLDFPGDEVETSRPGFEREVCLDDVHGPVRLATCIQRSPY